jgi:hypothetical protein
MYEKNTGKTVFFPFSFFPIFLENRFVHLGRCVQKNERSVGSKFLKFLAEIFNFFSFGALIQRAG